jgi:hypothetical protein
MEEKETRIKHRESLISAHHNYLVNNMLTPGFVIGKPYSKEVFYFLADLLLPGENTPRISARLFDEKGSLVVELNWNRVGDNPGRCRFQPGADGFILSHATGEPLLEVSTSKFANGFLTRIRGKLFDDTGNLRMEPFYEGVLIHGDAISALDKPFDFSKKSVP